MYKKIKKISPYILILLILVGLFSPMTQVKAEEPPLGICIDPTGLSTTRVLNEEDCKLLKKWTWEKREGKTREEIEADIQKVTYDKCITEGRGVNTCRYEAGMDPLPLTKPTTAETPFQKEIDEGCTKWPPTWFKGCLLKVFYYTLFQFPALILWLSAQFFDIMVDLGIKSSVTSVSGFIPAAWAVVRDLSNIFFILILLYIAIKTILGLGGSEVKKMIARVIIIALLINFSMFFTKIVIDSSNILALIFYNNLDVTNPDGIDVPIDPALGPGGKNISGAMWTNFDATRLINKGTIELLKHTTVNGINTKEENLPFSLTLGIMVVAGLIMLFAAYAFFVAGLMFIGRLIELWILIIFSPFAFMSWTVPKFASVEYLGWDAWLKRLISTAFMAPIFMFFMYLIFMLLPHISKFHRGSATILGTILGILIPALIIMSMLLKAVDFAKKGGGQFGEMALTGAKIAGGVALGVATGGAALALRGTVGRAATNLSESNRMRDWAARSKFGSGVTRLTSRVAAGTYDARNAPLVGTLAKAGGISLDSGLARKESFGKNRAARVKREEEFASKQLDTGDQGKAQLTRGKMSKSKASRVEAQLIKGGMTVAEAAGHRASLEGTGINLSQVSSVSRYLNAARRNDYANRLERREGGFNPDGTIIALTRAGRISRARRISANKIRLPATDAAKKASLADAMAAFIAAGGVPATTTPTTGGGGRAGGVPHP